MKIGYLLQSGAPEIRREPYSGPANHVRHVFKGLQELGHQLRLIAQYDGEIWESDDLEDFSPVYLPDKDRSAGKLLERGARRLQSSLQLPYFAHFESSRFDQACRQRLSGYDMLYERLGWFGYGGGLAAGRLQVPLVLEINGDLLSEMEQLGKAPHGLQRWISMYLFKRYVVSAAGYVAAGAGWRARFAEQWRVPPGRIAVVENGTEILRLLSRQQLRSFQPENVPGREISLVFVGGFDPWQGLEVLIQAVGLALRQGAEICLTLVGAGRDFEKIQKMVSECQLQDRVSFCGWLSIQETARVLANAEIGVSPYQGRTEFSGLKLYDYKAAGLAIVASGKNGEPGLLQHGKTGWIVPPGDPVALSEAILGLAANPDFRRRLGQAARIDAENNHSWERTVQKLNAVLTQVAA